MMKNNRTFKALTFTLAAAALSGAIACAACSNDTYLPDDPPYDFENPVEELPEYDSSIALDGVLDESRYSDLKWLETQYSDANVKVNVKSAAFLGEKGIFMLFDVDDPAVFVNPDRSGSWNSGIELYLARPGVTSLEGEAWEIDLTPGLDQVATRLQLGGAFQSMHTAEDETPIMRSQGKGGEVGATGSTGYTIEAFFPYAFLGTEREDLAYINMNTVLLRTYNYEDPQNRLWYNFGEESKSGYSWSDPESWWKFDENGLVCYTVTAETDGNGSLTAKTFNVLEHEALEIAISPKDGYRLKSITVDGEDRTAEVYIENGRSMLRIENILSDLTVRAEFAELPAVTHTLSGKLTLFGEELTAEQAASLSLIVNCGGAVYECAIDEKGSYLADIPEGEYTAVLSKEDGFVLAELHGELTADRVLDIDMTDTLSADILTGKEDFVKRFEETKISNTAGQLYDNKDHSESYVAPSVIESSFYAPGIADCGDGVRFGFRIYLKNENGGGAFTVADVVIGKTAGSWYLDIGYDLRSRQRNEYRLNEEQIAAVAAGSFKVLVVKEGAQHRLYAQNGTAYDLAAVYTDDDASMVSFSTIDLLVHNPDGKGTGEFGMRGTRVYANYAAEMTESELIASLVDCSIRFKPQVTAKDASVEIEYDYYSVGDSVSFTVTVSDPLLETKQVTVNGEEIQGTDGAYTYIIPEYAAGLDIRVVCGLLDGLYLPEVEDGGATVEGLGDVYRAGETLTFTVTGSNYVKIVGVRVNGELLSAEGNTYTYQIPEGSEELVIFVETETLAQKTEGEGDFSVNFSQATQSDVQGTLLLNPELLTPTVIEANFYAPNLPQMVANNIRFGLRMYLLNAEGGGEFTVADVVIARANGSWWLDAGYDLRNTNLPVRQLYKLSTRQIAAAAKGQLKILIVKDGASHRVYAQDGDIFEFAVEYVDDDATMVTFDSIVLLVNNSTAAKGIGKFGMHGVCMYSGYHENMDDEALVAMFADSKVGLAVDLKANDAEALGLKASYAAGETLQFTAAAADDLHEIDEVTINGERIDAKEGVYSWTVPEDATALEIKITIKVKDGILIPEVSSGAATVYGLKEYYKAGETVTFSAATDKFHAVTGAIVNGSSITMAAGTFRYVTKETDRTLDIVIQTITLAAEYTGKADIIKNFKDIEPSEDANHLLQGALYSCSDNGNRLPSPSVIVSSLYLEGFEDITENGTRFGLRIYNRKAGSNANEFAFDVILARQDDVWCLDMGSNNIIYNEVTPVTHYPLSSAQLNALKAGELQIAILQNGSTYSLYALDGNVFEFVESFTCTNGAASVSAIDLVVNNALVALQRSGDHEFGVKDMTVYGDHSTSMDAEEVIDFFLERDVALNATATAGEGVKITGVKNNYMAGETVEFTLTTEKFYEVASVTVNDVEVRESGGKYSYTLPADATSVNIVVTTTQTAVVYEGKADIIKNFKDIEPSGDANHLLQGALYSCSDNGNRLPSPSVIVSSLYLEGFEDITENGTRFGLRIYNRKAGSNANEFAFDVILARQDDVWCLDMGSNNIIYNEVTPVTHYPLSSAQLNALKAGELQIAILQNGSTYSLYALDGNVFEFVESFTCTNGAASVSAIDLVVNNALVALQRSGDHEFGVKDMTVYGDHSTSMDAEEVIDFFLERDVALNATATAGEGVKITGVKNNYMAGETVEFTLTTEKFYEVASVKVNGVEVRASGGKYSYTLPENATSVNIVVTTTRLVSIYNGKGEIIRNFKDITAESSSSLGGVYSCSDNSNALPSPSVTEIVLYGQTIDAIKDNGTRFGFRLYNRQAGNASNQYCIDIVIARQSNVWCLDMGSDLVKDSNAPSTAYPLSDSQIRALMNGTFRVVIIQEESKYYLYAENNGQFEFVESFTDTKNGTSVSAIDLIVNTGKTALECSGDRDFGVKYTTVYGDFSNELSHKALTELIFDSEIGYREYAGKGDDVTVKDFSDISSNGLKLVGPIYDKGDHGGIYLDKSVIEAHFTMPSIKSIQGDLNVGFRIYATDHNNTNNGWPDIILGRRDGNWYLNIGGGIGNSVISTAYQLSGWQIDAVEKGDLTILVVNDGIRHALYALDEGGFEKVNEYSDSNAAMITFKSIDFLAWNGANRTGTCGFTGLTVYGNFDETLSDEELVELFAGSNAE